MAKKIIVIIISVLIFNACSVSNSYYSYYPVEEIKTLAIKGTIKNGDAENSPLKGEKEYIIPYFKLEDYTDIYIYIRILKNGVNITDDEFVVYLGKIELDTGEIIKLPPLHLKKYVYITKGSILNTINPNGKFNQYYNTVEEYKKNGWKEE